MKQLVSIISACFLTALLSSQVLAAELKIGVVNVTDIYNKSTFVAEANKTLQANVKKMEEQLQTQKNSLQTMVTTYEKTQAGSKKTDLAKKITSAQTDLNNKTQQFQQKIQQEQAAGLQKFTQIVQAAVAKVAKAKQLNNVLNSNALIYTDNSWIDITKEVEAAMP